MPLKRFVFLLLLFFSVSLKAEARSIWHLYPQEDTLTAKKHKLEYYLPNTFVADLGSMARPLAHQTFPDTMYFFTVNFELGAGWYSYKTYDNYRSRLGWQIYGAGITAEYRLPFFNHPDEAKRFSGQTPRSFFLNGTLEYAGGFDILGFQIGVHAGAAYSTEFLHHYFKPGIGYSLRRLQVDFNALFCMGKTAQPMPHFGFSLRYIFAREE